MKQYLSIPFLILYLIFLFALFMGATVRAEGLTNISTRGYVGTNDQVMIAGFITDGPATNVVIRALGPSLVMPGALADPTIELHDATGALKSSNDDFVVGNPLPPSNRKESVITGPLAKGAWTVIVRGKGGATGIALVEVYNITPPTTPTPRPTAAPTPAPKRSVTVQWADTLGGDHYVIFYGALGVETAKALPINVKQWATPPLPIGVRHFFIIDRVMPNGQEFFVRSYSCTITATGCDSHE